MWGWAWGDVPQVPSHPPRLLEGLPQAPEDIRVVLGCEELAGVDSLRVERMGQHGFPCGLQHPSPRPAGVDGSPRTPCGAGEPGPRRRGPPGPTSAAPTAACGSSAATTVHRRARGLGWGRERGRGCVWCGHGDWWRWWARGNPPGPVLWGCAGSGSKKKSLPCLSWGT